MPTPTRRGYGDDGVDRADARGREARGRDQDDFILSAEIMAITLAAIPSGNILTKALVLAAVASALPPRSMAR